MGGRALNAPIMTPAAAPAGNGYYMLGSDGGVFRFGSGAGVDFNMVGSSPSATYAALAVTTTGSGVPVVDQG